jgi:hypothetical protein
VYTVLGLPLHPLVVHGTVVVVPVAALTVVVAGLWRRARARLAWPAFVASVLATGLVGLAGVSGGPFASELPPSPLVAHHAFLAKVLVVWVLAMTGASFSLAYAVWRRAGFPVASWLRVPRRLVALARPRWAAQLAAVRWILPLAVGLSVLTGVGTLVQVVLVGHSGAAAAWSNITPTGAGVGHR